MTKTHFTFFLILSLSPVGSVAPAQTTTVQNSTVGSSSLGAGESRTPFGNHGSGDASLNSPAVQEKLEKSRQSERQKKMIADTEKLLALATQLKADMDKTTKDTMSIDVIKKAEEIEKLARNVKDRMKG